MEKLIIPEIYLKDGMSGKDDPVKLAEYFSEAGADAIILYDLSSEAEEHENNLAVIGEIYRSVEIPLFGGGNINDPEDVEKLLLAGCQKAILNFSKESNHAMLKEVSERFGKEYIAASVDCMEQLLANNSALETYASMVVAVRDLPQNAYYKYSLPIVAATVKEDHDIFDILEKNAVMGVTGAFVSKKNTNFMKIKNRGHQMGIETNVLRSEILWEELKQNKEGLVPVVVQDVKTKEVLTLAYMNEDAFKKTLELGKMTYYSRSRKRLWTRGIGGGQVQYVKSLTVDSDYDAILAQVSQMEGGKMLARKTSFLNTMMEK